MRALKLISKEPAPHLMRVGTGFRKRSCSNKELERDDDSRKNHPALLAGVSLRASADARDQGAQIVRGLEGRQRDGGPDGTPVAPGREHCLLERACDASCDDMGATQISSGERRENG